MHLSPFQQKHQRPFFFPRHALLSTLVLPSAFPRPPALSNPFALPGSSGFGLSAAASAVDATAFSFGPATSWGFFTIYVLASSGALYALCPVAPFGEWVFFWWLYFGFPLPHIVTSRHGVGPGGEVLDAFPHFVSGILLLISQQGSVLVVFGQWTRCALSISLMRGGSVSPMPDHPRQTGA
eukprot:1159949-Pelagomonas_calceolata.AAC.4